MFARLRSYFREHWKLTSLFWFATLPIPLFHFYLRGGPPFWFRVFHLYYMFFGLLLAVFTHFRDFIETLPHSLIAVLFVAGALCIHIALCSWFAHFLGRRAVTKRLFRWFL